MDGDPLQFGWREDIVKVIQTRDPAWQFAEEKGWKGCLKK